MEDNFNHQLENMRTFYEEKLANHKVSKEIRMVSEECQSDIVIDDELNQLKISMALKEEAYKREISEL